VEHATDIALGLVWRLNQAWGLKELSHDILARYKITFKLKETRK